MFYYFCRMCLMCSLRQCGIILEFIKVKKIQTRFHGRGKNEASHYCHDCDVGYFFVYLFFLVLILYLNMSRLLYKFIRVVKKVTYVLAKVVITIKVAIIKYLL